MGATFCFILFFAPPGRPSFHSPPSSVVVVMPRVPTRSSSKKSDAVDLRALSVSELPLPAAKRGCHEPGSGEVGAIPIASPPLFDLVRTPGAPMQQCTTASATMFPVHNPQPCDSTDHLCASAASLCADRSHPWNVPGPRLSAPGVAGVDVASYLSLQFEHQRLLQHQLHQSQESERMLQEKCAALEQVQIVLV